MERNVVAASSFQDLARSVLVAIVDYTDSPGRVRLVSEEFDPNDSTTYPASSAIFPTLTAGDVFEVEYDAVSGRWYLVAPDPDEGWDFVSTGGGETILGFVVCGLDDETPIGGNLFATPVAVGAAGEHINLPYVAMDVTDVILQAINPYVLV